MKKTLIWILVNVLILIGVFTFVKSNFVAAYDSEKMFQILEEENLSELMEVARKNEPKFKETVYRKQISNLEDKNILKNISPKKILEKIDKKDSFFVLVGEANCQYCQEFLPELSKELNKNKVEIFYLDANQKDNENKGDLKKVEEKLNIKGFPTLIKFKGSSFEEFGEEEFSLDSFLKN